MRRAFMSMSVITAAGALIGAAGAYSTYTDTDDSRGGVNTGTVQLAVNGPTAKTGTFTLTGACIQSFINIDAPSGASTPDSQNLGTVNNTGCTSVFTVHNSGSLPFELSGTTLTDANPAALTCFTSTLVTDLSRRHVLLPGEDRLVTVQTLETSDAPGCQNQTNTVTANLLATEARPERSSVVNGDFADALTGWTTGDQNDGHWQQVTFDGDSGTLENSFSVPAPPDKATAAAVTQQGPGDHVLFQDVVLSPSGTSTLSFDFAYENYAGGFVQAASLSSSESENQQIRIDVMRAGTAPDSVAPADILLTLLTTPEGSPLEVGWTHRTADLTAFAGTTVRIRFAEVDNRGFQYLAVTNVKIT